MSDSAPAPVLVSESSGISYFTLRHEWAAAIADLELASYPTADPEDLYDAHGIGLLCDDFPQGGFAGFDGDRLVAMGVGVRMDFDFSDSQHRIQDMGHDDVSGDDPKGQWYYGTGIAVDNDYRRRGIGNELYRLRKEVCRQLNLRGLVAGGVLPGFADHIKEMSVHEYLDKVQSGELSDPTLSFQLANGFEVKGALEGYIRDPAVGDWASLIAWPNPDYQPQGLQLQVQQTQGPA